MKVAQQINIKEIFTFINLLLFYHIGYNFKIFFLEFLHTRLIEHKEEKLVTRMAKSAVIY